MGILDWLKGKGGFTRYADAYAMSRSALWTSVCEAINVAVADGKIVWVVVHFTNTFSALQDLLDQNEIDYEIVARPMPVENLERTDLFQPGTVRIVLSELLPVTGAPIQDFGVDHELALIVTERHPSLVHDQVIENLARNLPLKVELGYYMALDDAIINEFVNETTVQLMKQLGMNEHELIASNMISRRLNVVLKRNASKYITDHSASSAEEWIELNKSK